VIGGWPVRALGQGQLSPLALTAVVLLVSSSVIGTMVMMLPVAAYYRNADLLMGRYDVQVDALITPDVLAAAEELSEPGSAVAFVTIEPAVVVGRGRRADHVSVFLTRTPERIGQAWFPDDTTLSGPVDVGADWVDISANISRLLGVGPGDEIALEFLGNPVVLSVRRVIAVSRQGFKNVAVGNLGPLMGEALKQAEHGATPTVLVMRTSLSPAEVHGAIDAAADVSDPQVTSRVETLASRPPEALSSQGVQAAVTLLGIGILVALAMREGASVFSHRRRDLTILWALGATLRQSIGALVALESVVVVVTFPLAYLSVRWVYDSLLGPSIPPSLLMPLQLGFVVAALGYLLVIGVSARRRLQVSTPGEN
jgi:hypothetical protein